MIYYQVISRYVDLNAQSASLILTRSCEDLEYNSHLAETRLMAKIHIVNTLKNAEASYTEEVRSLTLTQFNNIVKGPDDLSINFDILNEYDLNEII